MCEGRFPGRIALYWAPSWILLLPFGPIEGCSNWQSFTISQHWWRFRGSHSLFFSLFFSNRIDFEITLSLPSVCMGRYICVHSSVYVGLCVRLHSHTDTHTDTHTHTCTRLNASLGNCLNGIRGDYGSCLGDGTVGMTWENTHTLHSWHERCRVIQSKNRWYVVTRYVPKTPQGCEHSAH